MTRPAAACRGTRHGPREPAGGSRGRSPSRRRRRAAGGRAPLWRPAGPRGARAAACGRGGRATRPRRPRTPPPAPTRRRADPLRAFLASLREGGYRGAVSIECVWQDLAAEAADALAALREADGIPAATAGQDHPAPRAVTGELVSVSPRPTTARTAVISRNGGW